MDHLQTRLDALEQQMHTVNRRLRWWRGLACGLAVLGLLGWGLPLGLAKEEDPDKDKGQKGLAHRVATLEKLLKHFSRKGDQVFITGANLHIVNGLGSTSCVNEQGEPIPDCPNGLGNLIVGYNEPRLGDPTCPTFVSCEDFRTGSHNIVVGRGQNFSRVGGLVVGNFNTISGDFASVSGGEGNTASNRAASVSGGFRNTASGLIASVSGGQDNTASGQLASVSGGLENTASDNAASVSGGWGNTAGGDRASVSGGRGNTASGRFASVSGGVEHTAGGELAWVSGGFRNTASGDLSSVSGGTDNLASGFASAVSGGVLNTASGDLTSVSGGEGNTASGRNSSVSGGFQRTALGQFNWVAGSLVEDQ